MRSESYVEENGKSSSLAWITVITALSVTATAIIVAKKLRANNVRAQVGDLVHLCDRAAQTLEDRLYCDYAIA